MKNLFIISITLFTFLFFACNTDEPGCMDSSATNYNIDATEDDGSCIYGYTGPDNISVDSEKIHRKVIIIGIDGLRSDVVTAEIMPFMDSISLSNNGYYNLAHLAEEDTYSGPNWSSMLTGVHMNKHNVTNNEFQNDNYSTFPPFFHYIETADNNINTASIVNWTPINTHILSDYADTAPEESINDATVFETAQEILETSSADVLFLQFDELDGAGHEHGFSPEIEEYINTASTLDGYAKGLFEIIENKRSNEEWMFFIISDHGGEDYGHGDASNDNIRKTVFFAENPDVNFQASCCYASSQVDLAPTILSFMGISSTQFDANTDGFSIILE